MGARNNTVQSKQICYSGSDSTKKMLRYTCGSLDSSVCCIHVNSLRIYLMSENNQLILSTLLQSNSNLLDKFILTIINFETDHWLFDIEQIFYCFLFSSIVTDMCTI